MDVIGNPGHHGHNVVHLVVVECNEETDVSGIVMYLNVMALHFVQQMVWEVTESLATPCAIIGDNINRIILIMEDIACVQRGQRDHAVNRVNLFHFC